MFLAGLVVTAVMTSCAASPARVTGRLAAVTADSVLSEFSQVIRTPAVPLSVGRTLTASLTPHDPVFDMQIQSSWEMYPGGPVVEHGPPDLLAGPHSTPIGPEDLAPGGSPSIVRRDSDSSRVGISRFAFALDPRRVTSYSFRTYFDLYRVGIATPGPYVISVVPHEGNTGLGRTIVVPLVRVLGEDGEVIEARVEPDLKGGNDEKSRIRFTAPGDYFVFVGADNSRPGAAVGTTVVTIGGGFDGTRFHSGTTIPVEIASSGEGQYSLTIKQRKER
jgi:hypothetical protein